MFAELVDCPKCGKKESAWPGYYCGECEAPFQGDRFRDASVAYDKYIRKIDEDERPVRFAQFLRMFA